MQTRMAARTARQRVRENKRILVVNSGQAKWRVEVIDCATRNRASLDLTMVCSWRVAGGEDQRDIREREGTGNGGDGDATSQINLRAGWRCAGKRGSLTVATRKHATVPLDEQDRDA